MQSYIVEFFVKWKNGYIPELLSEWTGTRLIKLTFYYKLCCRHLRPPPSPAVYPSRPPTFPMSPSQATFLLAVTMFPAAVAAVFPLGEAYRAVTGSHAPSSPSPVSAYPTCQIYSESEQIVRQAETVLSAQQHIYSKSWKCSKFSGRKPAVVKKNKIIGGHVSARNQFSAPRGKRREWANQNPNPVLSLPCICLNHYARPMCLSVPQRYYMSKKSFSFLYSK